MPDRIVELDYGAEKRQTTVAQGQEHELGDVGMLRDGRTFRYNFMDGAVTAGKLLQTSANVANHDMDLVTAIAAIGATTITVTLGATALAKDAAKNGYLYVNSLVGAGQLFKIATHAAVASGGSFACPIQDEGGVRTALDATSLCGIMYDPFKDVIVAPTTPTGDIVGVTVVDRADNTYGWGLVQGISPVLINGTVIIGRDVTRGVTTAGSVDTYPITLTEAAPNTYVPGDVRTVGQVTLIVAVTTDHGMVKFNIQ